MFDSPFEWCSACGEFVLLDQTREQCAREHRCAGACPFRQFFTGIPFDEAAAPAPGRVKPAPE